MIKERRNPDGSLTIGIIEDEPKEAEKETVKEEKPKKATKKTK